MDTDAMNDMKPIAQSLQELINVTRNPEAAAALIDQLLGGSASRLPEDAVSEWIDALLRGVPYPVYPFPEGRHLFRGRIVNSRIKLDKAEEFSYKPNNNEPGRCHRAGETMFYGALNLDTIFSELHPEIGDRVHVGRAKLRDGRNLSLTAIGEIDHVRRYDRPLIGNDKTQGLLADNLAAVSEEEKARILLVDAFFADLFSRPASSRQGYKATSILSRHLLGSQHLDGFIYPSVAHRGGLNCVIQPQSFDALMEWDQFMAFEITGNLGFGLYRQHQYAAGDSTDEDGNILWR